MNHLNHLLNHLLKNTEYVHINSNDETHLHNSQPSTHILSNLTDGLGEGRSSSLNSNKKN